MKILSITAQKPHSTGSGTYLTELVRSWERAGHEQAVVCGIYHDDTVSFPEGVSCYPVYFTSGHSSFSPDTITSGCDISFPIVSMSDIMPYESTLYRDLTPSMVSEFEKTFISTINTAVSDLDPDLIICHHLFLLTALVKKHFPERMIAGISHGTDLRQMMNCDNLRDIVRPQIASLDYILALHENQKAHISEIFGVSPDRIIVIGSGYNDSLFNTGGRAPFKDPDPIRICYAGKMSSPKGVPELLDVLVRLADDPDVPHFTATLAGGCRDESVLERLNDLPSYIKWLGQIPQAELADIMKSSEIFVLPSYFEGLPLVLIEAMASGAVPVSTDLPGVKPWIDSNVPGSTAVFVPMPDMKTIDTPTDEGRNKFREDLFNAVRGTIKRIYEQGLPAAPDTSSITWDSVAERIAGLC